MKHYYLKKSIFAAVFLASLLGFSVYNAVFEAEELGKLGTDFLQIRSVEDMKSWIAKTEEQVSDEIAGHTFFIETYSRIQQALRKREFDNFSLIKDSTGMLYYGSTYQTSTEDLEEFADQIRQLQKLAADAGASLLVVLPPSKVLYGVSQVDLSWPINDPNPRMDKLLMLLQQRQVPAADLRIALQKSGEPLDRLFFKTTHHWTALGAFYGMREIVDQAEQKFGMELDPGGYYRDLNNYEIQLLENSFLGSNGRSTGIPYSGLDDFEYIWLCQYEDTDFSWINHDEEEEIRGNLKQSLLREKALEAKDPYKDNFYNVYINSISNEDTIVNHRNPNGLRIAALRDSYFSPVACFLAPMCSQIDMFWNRKSEAVQDYISAVETGDYDLVILEIYPYNLDQRCFSLLEEAMS